MKLAVDGWFEETHGQTLCRFACIQYEHFGFAVTREQAEDLTHKLVSLLENGTCQTDERGVLHVDWSQSDSDWVMIAFRPVETCRGRFYDLPREVATELCDRLQRLLETSGPPG